MNITLNSQQIKNIEDAVSAYDKYQVVAEIIRQTPGYNPNQLYWFEQAAYINKYVNAPQIENPSPSARYIEAFNKLVGKTPNPLNNLYYWRIISILEFIGRDY